jgi:hypothetical protein
MLQYADGYAYSKSKFEEGLRIVLADKPAKPAKTHSNVKKEDVDLIVRCQVSSSLFPPFNLPFQRSQNWNYPADKLRRALSENNGDLAQDAAGAHNTIVINYSSYLSLWIAHKSP